MLISLEGDVKESMTLRGEWKIESKDRLNCTDFAYLVWILHLDFKTRLHTFAMFIICVQGSSEWM